MFDHHAEEKIGGACFIAAEPIYIPPQNFYCLLRDYFKPRAFSSEPNRRRRGLAGILLGNNSRWLVDSW
jgi:hypothetical protein